MPRINIPIRAFIGMNPQKGAHLLQVDPEIGMIEPLELAGVKPQVLPNIEPRKALVPLHDTSGTGQNINWLLLGDIA